MADNTTILNRLISALTSQDPSWDVSVGTAEYKILEAVANELAIAANNNTLQNYSFDVNTKSGNDLDAFCALFGIYRNYGKRATGTATFSTSTNGIATGVLTIASGSTGTFTAAYNGVTSATVSANSSTLNSDIQNALAGITPAGTVVNVAGTNSPFSLTFTPPLPPGSLTFNFANVSATTAPSWVPTGGATSTYEIAMGTQIYAPSNVTGTVPIYYQTTAASSIAQGSSQVQVPIQAVLPGSNGNLTAGAVTSFGTTLVGVSQVTNSVLSGGTDPETDAQLRQRWNNTVFKNLAGTEDQFRALAYSNSDNTRVQILGPQEQNTEHLQIQTQLKIASKYTSSSLTSNNGAGYIQSYHKFQPYASVTVNATWTVTGSGSSSVITIVLPSGTNSNGIYPGMNIVSGTINNPTIYIPLTMLAIVNTITSNSDGTTTITTSQTTTISPGANATIPAPITFCIPATTNSLLTNNYDPTLTTVQQLQNNLNYAFNGPIINDIQQLVSLIPIYNTANLYVTATGGSFTVTYTSPNGTSASYTANYNSTAATFIGNVQTAFNYVLKQYGYQCIVTQNNNANGYTQAMYIDFFTYSAIVTGGTPVNVSTVNQYLSFNFASLNGTGANAFWSVPSGLLGTINQLAYCNFNFAKPLDTNLTFMFGRIDSGSVVSWSGGTPAQIGDTSTLYPPDIGSYVYGPNVPANSYVITSGYFGGNYFTINNSMSAGFGGAGIQLLFQVTNPYTFSTFITTSIPDSQYFYPQGLEAIQGTNSNGLIQTASPSTDYTYVVTPAIFTNGTASPLGNVITIASLSIYFSNGNNYSWLYPGSIVSFTYYYVSLASRNQPVYNAGSSSWSINSNYVDIVIDGINAQLISEDVTLNASGTNLTPGSSGLITSSNKSNWVLGDGVTQPVVGDIYYIFSQQPVVQPVYGIYPQELLLSQANGNHSKLQAYSGPIGGSEPTIKIGLTSGSTTGIVPKTQMYPVYYKQNVDIPESSVFSSIPTINNYSRSSNIVTLSQSAGVTGTYNNVIINSDFYPIYDNTITAGSPQAMNGICIRQTSYSSRTETVGTTSGSNFITDTSSSLTLLDVGQIVTGGTAIPSSTSMNTRIQSVVPGVGFTMSQAATSTGSITATIYRFCQTPTISNGDQLFNLQYYVDSDVTSTDNLIQQQRLLGVSTMTHLANFQPIMINLVVVLDGSVSASTVTSNINTKMTTYLNSLSFYQPVQISSIISNALSIQGVTNARIATTTDSSSYYGIQLVAPYTYYDAIQDIVQGSASNVDFRDIIVTKTYTGDVLLQADMLPQLFRVNVYTRSQSDF